jgi:tungstate transport system ATP-binding protein
VNRLNLPLIQANNIVVKRGNSPVLQVSELHLHENEVMALIGPNGAGKSTLLLSLACLLPLSSGTINWRGEIIDSDSQRLAYRRRLAMVFQEPLLFDTTVFENVASGLKIRGMTRGDAKKRVMETLDLFGISQLAGRSARKISGGEAQRTSLARGFALKPEMILLDEPFSSLDPPTRAGLTEDLARILDETKTAAIMATHDQLDTLRLTDRIAVMNGGEIIQSGPPVDVMNRPADEFVASFVGMENILRGRITGSSDGLVSAKVMDRDIVFPGGPSRGGDVVLCIRPENVAVSTIDPGSSSSVRNVFPSVIGRVENMGAYFKITLDCGFTLVASVTSQSVGEMGLTPGKPVFASFKATAVHLIRGCDHQ